MIEYTLIAAMIWLVIFIAVSFMAKQNSRLYSNIGSAMTEAIGS